MSLPAHRIRRLTWLVCTRSATAAFVQRQAIRDQFESVLLPALERVFDKFHVDGRIVHIPKLTLHMAADFATIDDLVGHLEEQLHAVLSGETKSRAAEPAETALAGRLVRHEATTRSTAEHRRELLLVYLRSGRIEWHADLYDLPATLDWLRAEAESLASDPAAIASVISGALAARIAIGFRLLQLLQPETRAILLQGLPLTSISSISELLLSCRSASRREFEELSIAAVLLALSAHGVQSVVDKRLIEILQSSPSPAEDRSVVAAITKSVTDSPDESVELPSTKTPEPRTTFSAAARLPGAKPVETVSSQNAETTATGPQHDFAGRIAKPDRTIRESRPTFRATDTGPQQDSGSTEPGPPQSEATLEPHAVDEVSVELALRAMAIEPAAAVDAPGVLARDAGLILLHPYLPRLLEATGIAGSTARRLPADLLPRAAALLHWLINGRDTVYEFEVSVSKVLLGLAPDDPLPVADGLLSDADRDEADAMLAAVIEHWSALRNTSITGLRTSFLQRAGLLRGDANRWRLRMETKSFDVLLGQLPWGITVVKLPWMTKPIFTDWPTP